MYSITTMRRLTNDLRRNEVQQHNFLTFKEAHAFMVEQGWRRTYKWFSNISSGA